jgi:hypothetical protein
MRVARSNEYVAEVQIGFIGVDIDCVRDWHFGGYSGGVDAGD